MQPWVTPAALAFLCWGIWAFLPKLTTRFIDPRSAIVYEAVGGVMVALFILVLLDFRPASDWRGVTLGAITGVLGALGALAYLFAVLRGPVTLISTVTALYPVVAILLAHLFLHESISLKQGLGIVLGLIAIILIST